MFNKFTYNGATYTGGAGSSAILASASALISVVVSSAIGWVARVGSAAVSMLVSAVADSGGTTPGQGTFSASVSVTAAPVIQRASAGTVGASVTTSALAQRETFAAGAATQTMSGAATGLVQDNAAAPADRRMTVPTDNRTMVVPA